MLSLAIVGLMVGLMIGRLTTPDERELQQVQATQDGLELWFNEEPKLHGENVEGTVALLFQAQGKAQQGQLSLQGKPVSFTGTTTIDRREFGMKSYQLIVGNKVDITLRARMVPR